MNSFLKTSSFFVLLYALISLSLFTFIWAFGFNSYSSILSVAVALGLSIFVSRFLPEERETDLRFFLSYLTPLYFLIHLILIFLPHTANDDLIYHLPYLQQIVERKGFVFDPMLMNFDLSKLFELPLVLLSFEHFKWVKTSNFIIGWFISGLLFTHLKVDKKLKVALTIGVFLSPVFSDLINGVYVELFLTVSILLAGIFYERYEQNHLKVDGLFCCVFLGIACATKIIGLIFVLVFFVHELAKKHVKRPQVYAGLLIATLIPLPWIAQNFLFHHNPFFPLLGEIFPSPHVSTARYSFYQEIFSLYHSGYNPLELARAFLASMFVGNFDAFGLTSKNFNGALSLILLVACIGVTFLKPKKLGFFILLTMLLIWLFKTQQARFLLPAIVVCLLFIRAAGLRRKLLLTLAIAAVFQGIHYNAKHLKRSEALSYVTGKISKQEYLGKNIGDHQAVADEINNAYDEGLISLGAKERAYMIGGFSRSFYIKAPVVTNMYYEVEPLVQSFQKGTLDSSMKLQQFWNQNHLRYLIIVDKYVGKVLEGQEYFDWPSWLAYKSQYLSLVSTGKRVSIYKILN